MYSVELGFSVEPKKRNFTSIPLTDGEFDFEHLSKIITNIKTNFPTCRKIVLTFRDNKEEWKTVENIEFKCVTHDQFWVRFNIDEKFTKIIDMVHDEMNKTPEERTKTPRQKPPNDAQVLFNHENGQVVIVKNRVQLKFAFRPDRETRQSLKNEGFKFQPFTKRWYADEIPQGMEPDDDFIDFLKLTLKEATNELR